MTLTIDNKSTQKRIPPEDEYGPGLNRFQRRRRAAQQRKLEKQRKKRK